MKQMSSLNSPALINLAKLTTVETGASNNFSHHLPSPLIPNSELSIQTVNTSVTVPNTVRPMPIYRL